MFVLASFVPTLGEVWFKQQTQDGGGDEFDSDFLPKTLVSEVSRVNFIKLVLCKRGPEKGGRVR